MNSNEQVSSAVSAEEIAYPTVFNDIAGEAWDIALRPSMVERLRAELNFDLWKAADLANGPLAKLAEDERLEIEVLWLLCEGQARPRGIDKAAFADRFNGAVFDAGVDALKGAMLVFFSGARAAQLRKMFGELRRLREDSLRRLDALHSIAHEEREKILAMEKERLRAAILESAPQIIDREIKQAISTVSTSTPPVN